MSDAAMRQPRLQLPLHRPAVDDKGVDHVFMTGGEVVVVVVVAVKHLDDGAAGVECRRHGQLQQIVGEEHSFARWNGRVEPPQHGVQVLDRRLEFEGRLVIGVEPAVEPRIFPQRVVRQDDAVGEFVGTPESEQALDDVQHAPELVGNHADDAGRGQRSPCTHHDRPDRARDPETATRAAASARSARRDSSCRTQILHRRAAETSRPSDVAQDRIRGPQP